MALRVWLPLAGTLENKGVSNIIATNSGATVNTSGKIGSCYAFNGSSKITATGVSIPAGSISASAWVYFDTNITDLQYVVSLNGGSGFADHEVGLAIQSSSYYFVVGGNSNCAIGTPVLNTWTHMAVTFDGNTIRGYINGTLVKSVSSTATLTKTTFTIGARNNGSTNYAYFLKGRANDVRIYDHCLSAAEVHEISQGLVLHYKLDDNIQTITNAFNMGSWNTNTASGGFSVWGPSGHSGSRGTNTDRQYIYSPDRSYSYWIAHGANTDTSKYYIFYQSPAFNGGYRSLSCIVKEENSLPIDDAWFMPGWNANVIGEGHAPVSTWTHKYPLGNGFYLCQVDGFYQNGSNDLVSLTVNNGHKVYISEIWLEDNKQVASNPLAQSTTMQIQDSSGYGHNGTKYGNITCTSNSARYSNCLYIPNGNTDYIYTDAGVGNPSDAITMNIWFKSSNKTPGTDYHHCFNGLTSWVYIEMAVHKNGYMRSGLYISGARYVANTSNTNILDGNWHMLTLTYNGAQVKRYVDGVLRTEATQNATGAIDKPNDRFVFGRGASTGYYCKEAYLSDARIYATALSADDILSLYHTAAKVNNLGGLHTFEAIENIPNIIFKIDSARGAKVFQDGLSRYTQSQCQVTLTDEGYHIYRPPNLVYSSAGKVMWGGLKLVNQTSDTVSPYNASRDNVWGLQKTHTYLFAFHAKGQSSNSPSLNVQNNMGWDRIAGMGPNPTYISTSTIPANFNGEKDCYIIFTINDDIIKTATKTEGGYTTGEQYLSYRDLSLNYGYTDTGALGTDLYLTDFRLYDVTNYIGQIKKTGITNFSDYVERNGILQIRNKAELLTSNLIER